MALSTWLGAAHQAVVVQQAIDHLALPPPRELGDAHLRVAEEHRLALEVEVEIEPQLAVGGGRGLQAGAQLAEPALVRDDRDGAAAGGERGQAVQEGQGAPSHGSVVLAVLDRRELCYMIRHL
eukprot:scaffold100019_cov80-Phaeocystis_antarctica.AAC.4